MRAIVFSLLLVSCLCLAAPSDAPVLEVGQIRSGGFLMTLPTADGTSGQVLSTDGSGVLSFITASGGGSSGPIDLANTHISVTGSGSVTYTPGADIGTDGTTDDGTNQNTGSDTSGRVRITTGTGAALGSLAVVSFEISYDDDVICLLTPANQVATDITWAAINPDVNGFTIYAGGLNSIQDETEYLINYHCFGSK